jgi:hypothetical protein
MAKTMPKLGLKYTTWDRTNGLYVYQRVVPENAVWLIQIKKINDSLGKTPAEAKAKYIHVHPKWEKRIRDRPASTRGRVRA